MMRFAAERRGTCRGRDHRAAPRPEAGRPSGTAKRTAELISRAGGNVGADPLGPPPGLVAHQEVSSAARGDALDPPRLDRSRVSARRAAGGAQGDRSARASWSGWRTCSTRDEEQWPRKTWRGWTPPRRPSSCETARRPRGAGRRRDRRDRGGQPGAQRGDPRRCFERAREQRGRRAARRSVPRRAVPAQGPAARTRGRPVPRGMKHLTATSTGARPRTPGWSSASARPDS